MLFLLTNSAIIDVKSQNFLTGGVAPEPQQGGKPPWPPDGQQKNPYFLWNLTGIPEWTVLTTKDGSVCFNSVSTKDMLYLKKSLYIIFVLSTYYLDSAL